MTQLEDNVQSEFRRLAASPIVSVRPFTILDPRRSKRWRMISLYTFDSSRERRGAARGPNDRWKTVESRIYTVANELSQIVSGIMRTPLG